MAVPKQHVLASCLSKHFNRKAFPSKSHTLMQMDQLVFLSQWNPCILRTAHGPDKRLS